MSPTTSRVRLAALAAAAGLLLVGLAASPVSAEELPDASVSVPTVETEPEGAPEASTPDEEGSTPTPPLGPDGTPLDPPTEEEPPVDEEVDPGVEPWPPISDLPAPVIEVENTVYPEGDWLDGIHVTGSGFVPGIEAGVGIRAGEGTLAWQLVEVAPDGTIDVVIVPVDFVGADTPDRPKFMVQGSQVLEDGSYLLSNEVQLTITSAEVPTPPAPPAEQPAAEAPAPAPGGDQAAAVDGLELAETGYDAVGSAVVALVLVAAGGLVLVRRRLETTR